MEDEINTTKLLSTHQSVNPLPIKSPSHTISLYEEKLLDSFLQTQAYKSVTRLLWFLCINNKTMFLSFITLYLRSAAAILSPKTYSKLVDLVATAAPVAQIKQSFVMMVVLAIFYGLCKFTNSVVDNHAVYSIDKTLSTVVHAYLSNQDAAYRANLSSVRFGVNLTNLLKMSKIWSKAVKIFGLSVEIIIALGALCYHGDLITNSILLVFICAYVIFFLLTDKPHRSSTIKNAIKWNSLTQSLINSFNFLNTTNIFNRQRTVHKQFSTTRDKTMRARSRMLWMRLLITSAIEFSFIALHYSTFAFLVISIIKGKISISMLTLFGILIYRVYHCLKDILGEFKIFEDISILSEALHSIFCRDIKLSIEYINEEKHNAPFLKEEDNKDISIRNLTVRVQDINEIKGQVEENILNIRKLKIKQGGKYVVIGPSGCGKSSLAKVLVGLWRYDGELHVGPYHLRDLDLKNLRSNVTLISQETDLLPMSILDNIRYSSPNNVTEAQVKYAARLACVDEVIEDLPNKYHSILDQSIGLSAGERQRIALARVFLSEAKIIILDESTSSLDVPTEMKIYENLSEFAKDRTLIIIAHRMAVLRYFPNVIFIQAGAVNSIGKHKNLLKNNLIYKQFVDATY